MAAMGPNDLAVTDADKLAADEELARPGFWRKLRRVMGRIPFAEELVAAYYCATDRQTPTYVRGVLMGAIGYFIVPTDMIPDFIATLGFVDDATVLGLAIASVSRHIKPEHKRKALAFFEAEGVKPTGED
jgi:uncharacterized membrane protein YkvA (DUF1232 family)